MNKNSEWSKLFGLLGIVSASSDMVWPYITFKSNIRAQKWTQIGSNIRSQKMYHWVVFFATETHFFRSLEHCDITVDLFSLINGNLMRVHKENSGIFLLFCTHPMCITTSLMVIAILFRITYPLFRKSGCEIKLIV